MDEDKIIARIAVIETKISFIADDIKDIKDNHLKSIYQKIECIVQKLSSKRPSWTVSWLITFLGSAVIGLLVLLFKRGG